MISLHKIQCQLDSAWRYKRLGTSKQTIGTAGCTITDLSMLNNFYGLGTTPDSLNEELKNNGGFYDGNLIIWSVFVKRFGYKSYKRSTVYNNLDVWTQINIFKRPVLVEVKAPKGVPGLRHWVIFIGSQKAIDPYTGKIELTSKYIPTGYCVIIK